tara:strand:- start:1369 stop:1746 length:378 start_codon:yes stop_codon:yes gene_type:complete
MMGAIKLTSHLHRMITLQYVLINGQMKVHFMAINKSTYWFIHAIGTSSNHVLPMAKSNKKVQFNAANQDIVIELQPKRRGVYWHYQDVPLNYGPFKSDNQAINDAKLYSTYGTTSKQLLKVGNHG